MINRIADRHLRYQPPRWRDLKMPVLLDPGHRLARTLFSLAEAVFQFEGVQRSGLQDRLDILLEPGWSSTQATAWEQAIGRLIRFVLLNDTEVRIQLESEPPSESANETNARTYTAACLFSGGVDSLSGVLLAAERFSSVLSVFCGHSDQSRVISIVNRLSKEILSPREIDTASLRVPKIEKRGYAQTRGFLYILAGAAVASTVDAKCLIISECGPTMYQPKFGPADIVTMTTHPFVVERARDVLHTSTSGISLELGNENRTKAEVMAVCPSPDLIPETHSCVSQRLREHDGTCFGCVIRRLAAIAAGVPDRTYARDPLTEPTANGGNLMALLDFCSDVLLSREEMPEYQSGPIEASGKWDLFERYALDNFAALYYLRRHGVSLTPVVGRHLELIQKSLGERVLAQRLATLRTLARDFRQHLRK